MLTFGRFSGHASVPRFIFTRYSCLLRIKHCLAGTVAGSAGTTSHQFGELRINSIALLLCNTHKGEHDGTDGQERNRHTT